MSRYTEMYIYHISIESILLTGKLSSVNPDELCSPKDGIDIIKGNAGDKKFRMTTREANTGWHILFNRILIIY